MSSTPRTPQARPPARSILRLLPAARGRCAGWGGARRAEARPRGRHTPEFRSASGCGQRPAAAHAPPHTLRRLPCPLPRPADGARLVSEGKAVAYAGDSTVLKPGGNLEVGEGRMAGRCRAAQDVAVQGAGQGGAGGGAGCLCPPAACLPGAVLAPTHHLSPLRPPPAALSLSSRCPSSSPRPVSSHHNTAAAAVPCGQPLTCVWRLLPASRLATAPPHWGILTCSAKRPPRRAACRRHCGEEGEHWPGQPVRSPVLTVRRRPYARCRGGSALLRRSQRLSFTLPSPPCGPPPCPAPCPLAPWPPPPPPRERSISAALRQMATGGSNSDLAQLEQKARRTAGGPVVQPTSRTALTAAAPAWAPPEAACPRLRGATPRLLS